VIAASVGNETVPAIDEQPPAIGPNLAGNQDLCKALTKHLTWTYWWPYELMQQRFWDACRKIDNAWRVRYAAQDLNFTDLNRQTVKQSAPLAQDGKSAIGQSVMAFKQIKAVTDLAEILSFADGLPMRAEVPEDMEEDVFYRPTAETAAALNAVFRINAERVNFRDNYRRAAGCFVKYGYGWVHAPFSLRRYEQPKLLRVEGPTDPAMLMQQAQIANPTARVEMTPQGPAVIEGRIDIQTEFQPLHVEDVYVDPFLPCSPAEHQPCPFVRTFASRETLRNHAYEPNANPFGFLNIETAIKEQEGHYMLTDQDMQPMRDRLKNRYNLNDQVDSGKKRSRAHQLWTAYPMLAISEQGELDIGEGITCPMCAGKKRVEWEDVDPMGVPLQTMQGECPECMATGKIQPGHKLYPPIKRYVVQFFGGLMVQTTCLRIQEMPEGMEIPIIFSADLVEDDAASIPMGLSEVMLVACEQVTRAECQFETGKENSVNRGFKVKWDSPAWKQQNLFTSQKIPFESDPKEVERMEQGTYDEGVTLLPYIEYKNAQIQAIGGATDTLLGQISGGRRSALEIGEAAEAAKNPLVIKVDRFNHQVPGRWARLVQRNLELFGDRNYIQRLTGRTYFGKCRIFTAVGEEFVKKIQILQALRETLQVTAADPAMQSVRPELWNEYFTALGIKTRVKDMGERRAMITGISIVNKILAEGIPDPALPSDPHEIYVRIFEEALKDDYWQQQYPQNIPLLYQRLLMQNQLLQQQQMMEMQQMMMQNQLMNGPGGGAPNPDKGRAPATDPGKQKQQAQG
jgi:hypothetical protein